MARCKDCSMHLSGKNGAADDHESKAQERKSKPPPTYTSKIYEQLPNKRDHIRLLNLRGSSNENPVVECELEVIEFKKDVKAIKKYEALSWCWGTAKPNSYITIRKDGKVFAKYVSPELVAALRTLRYPKQDRYLWIDAICINQKDDHEKNHQVEMMSDIYGKADCVCIWLGEGDKSSRMALKFIKKDVLQLQNFDELCESEQASEKWSALLDLMQRPWFSRRWVVQEIALARKAVVYCGNDKISWKRFAVAVELFVEVETATHRLSEVMKKDPKFYHVPGWFEYVSALGASLLVEATGKLFRDYKPNGPPDPAVDAQSETSSEYETDEEMEPESSSESDDSDSDSGPMSTPAESNLVQPLLSLEYLVSSLSIFQATVSHDIIYALLAIAKDTTPVAGDDDSARLSGHTQNVLEVFTEKKRYKVEYERPFVDVCKDFVLFCIEHSDESRALDIICRPWAPEDTKKIAKRYSPVQKKGKETANGYATPIVANPKDDSKSDENRAEVKRKKKKSKDNIPLPSWIPQLSGAAYAMYSQAGVHTLKMGRKNADTLVGLPPSNQSLQRNYNAAQTKAVDLKTLKFRKRTGMKNYSMYVRGFVLDTVQQVQPSSQGGAIPQEWAKTAGWRDCPDSDPPDDFWRTLVADRGRDGRNPPVYYSRACKESFYKGGLSSGSVNTTDLINNERCSVVAQFCRRVQAVIWNRSLIKTTVTRRLGLASQNVLAGDLVCILYGCSVPVILRQKHKDDGAGSAIERHNDRSISSEISLEVEEDLKHWQEDLVARMRRNVRRIKGFRDHRKREEEKYEIWNKKMEEAWRKDTEWRRSWQEHQMLHLKMEPKNISLTRIDPPKRWASDKSNACKEFEQRWRDYPDWRCECQNKEKERISKEIQAVELLMKSALPASSQWNALSSAQKSTSAALTEFPPRAQRRQTDGIIPKPQASEIPVIAVNGAKEDWLSKSNRSLSPLPENEKEEERKKDEGQRVKRWERKEFKDWKRQKKEEARAEEERQEELKEKESKEPEVKKVEIDRRGTKKDDNRRKGIKQEPEKVSREDTILGEPRVNWHEFGIFLRYGWRWKRKVAQKIEAAKLFSELRRQQAAQLRFEAKAGTRRPMPESQPAMPREQETPTEQEKEKETNGASHTTDDSAAPDADAVGIPLRETNRIRRPTHKSTNSIESLAKVSVEKSNPPCDKYLEPLRQKLRDKFIRLPPYQRPEDGTSDQEEELEEARRADEQKKIDDHNKRVEDNLCYYEFLGEAYVHGMMDGEAMAYQNEENLPPRVFELR